MTITGSVFSGLGEGKYYVSQQEYQSSFIRVLGYSPFPGTLNIRVSPELTDRVDMLRGSWPLIVPGFSTETRQFGEVLCYPVTILSAPSTRVAIIMPRRTHHGHSVLEIISDINLRETLSLSDGDELTLQYFFNHDRK